MGICEDFALPQTQTAFAAHSPACSRHRLLANECIALNAACAPLLSLLKFCVRARNARSTFAIARNNKKQKRTLVYLRMIL